MIKLLEFLNHKFKMLKIYRTIGSKHAVKALQYILFKKPVMLEVKMKDYPYPIFLRNLTSDVGAYNQIFINNEYKFGVSKMPEIIIDAGGNIGLAAIFFTNKYPSAKIFSIEPETANFKMLLKNTENYPNIIPIQAALWNETGIMNIEDNGFGNWGFQTTSGHLPENNSIQKIQSLTVNDIMEKYKLEKIDILKIDIESAELEVIEGCASWIDKVNSMIIELHEYMKPGVNRIFYNNTNGFDQEWVNGENIFLARDKYITPN